MHYLRARFVVLAVAMTFSLTPLGRTASASGDKPVPWSMIERNSILPLSAASPNVITRSRSLARYTKKIVAINMLWQPTLCNEVSLGAWTVTTDPKYGKIAFGKETIEAPRGECPGKIFTFATISYKWTAHNNKTINTTINDTFNAKWASDGWKVHYTFNITVPVVRPASETTAFSGWDPQKPTEGQWRQTLVPPADNDKFDFSEESVKEADAAGTHSDTCWFFGSKLDQVKKIAGGIWDVVKGNIWGDPANPPFAFDFVGWHSSAVTYYRVQHVVVGEVTIPPRAPCGFRVPQQMTIKADRDTDYNNYGELMSWWVISERLP